MSAVLIISIFLLVITSFAIYRTKRSPSRQEPDYGWLPAPPRALFDDAGAAAPRDSAERNAKALEARAAELRARAAQGDREALRDASRTGDRSLYGEVLEALSAGSADSPETRRELSDFIVRSNELRASPAFAELLVADFERAPARARVPELLRVAALSDDEGTYRRAVEAVSRALQEGRLAGYPAGEALSLFESEYWVLSADARRAGAGHLLKEHLADVRRRLARHARGATTTPAGPGENRPASH